MENLRSKPVEDLGSTVLELYLWVFSTDGTILSMTYTPTPNFGGSVPAGEFTFHYDACGNMVLMTNSSGDPQLSYDIDRATNGIVNTYNPGNMENIIGIGGRRGQLTIPGFGDDDMTLPIQRPGQFAVIGDNGQAGSGWINHTTTTGSSPGITGPCGEVGTCGFGIDCITKLCQDCVDLAWSTFKNVMRSRGWNFQVDTIEFIGNNIFLSVGLGAILQQIIIDNVRSADPIVEKAYQIYLKEYARCRSLDYVG